MTMIVALYITSCILALLGYYLVKRGFRICGLLVTGASAVIGMTFAWSAMDLGLSTFLIA